MWGFLPREAVPEFSRVRWALIHAISALSVGRSFTNAIVSAILLLALAGSGMAAVTGCGGGVVGGGPTSEAGTIGGAKVGAGAEKG